MSPPNRRQFIRTAATLAALTSTSANAAPAAQEPATLSSAFGHEHKPVPLPFDTKSLKGISERLIQSHWENNYIGAVKALNLVRSKLALAAADPNFPPYLYNGYKREQLLRTGSVALHELYFGNLGGDSKAHANLRGKLAKSFGSFDAWEQEFRKIGLGLGGGSGWVVLAHNRSLDLLENYWQADHAVNPPNSRPILVMDMYEHAYQMDYGAAAAKYIDAFFQNIHWDEVGRRLAAPVC